MTDSRLRKLCRAAVVGALYAAVTLLAAPISFGAIQCRVSEALCILPWLFPETAQGLFCGCILANLIGGYGPLDVVFGSLTTLAAGLLTARIPRRVPAALPPVILNGLIVGAVIARSTAKDALFAAFPIIGLEVAAGEAVALFALGLPLSLLLERIPYFQKQMRKNDAQPGGKNR